MYKIYINETPLLLGETQEFISALPGDDRNLVARYPGKKKWLVNYIDLLEKTNRYDSVTLFSNDPDQLFEDFKSLYKIIEAGGGLVINPEGAMLAIYRKNYWDLPKGKIEKGESPEQGAIREVIEETGLGKVSLGKFLQYSYHTYKEKNKRILKKTYWYKMFADQEKLTPQHEESIELADWYDIDTFLSEQQPIYKSIVDVIKAGK